jgi:hypothetical protein
MDNNTKELLEYLAYLCVPVFGSIITIVLTKILNRQDDLKKAAGDAKNEADLVKTTLEKTNKKVDAHNELANEKFDDLAQLAQSTHTLVNSAFGNQLKITAASKRQWADRPGATPQDVQDAETAELIYKQHLQKQAVVDQTHKNVEHDRPKV